MMPVVSRFNNIRKAILVNWNIGKIPLLISLVNGQQHGPLLTLQQTSHVDCAFMFAQDFFTHHLVFMELTSLVYTEQLHKI